MCQREQGGPVVRRAIAIIMVQGSSPPRELSWSQFCNRPDPGQPNLVSEENRVEETEGSLRQ